MRNLTPDEARSVLRCAVPATLASLDADGYPYLTPIWFLHHDGMFTMTSLPTRPHLINLRRDPRAALVVDLEGPATSLGRPNVQIKCRGLVKLTPDSGEWTRRITLKYTHSAELAERRATEDRILIELNAAEVIARAAGPMAPAYWWQRGQRHGDGSRRQRP